MHDHITHPEHDHEHGPDCGHTGLLHEGHVDYIHDGHLHHPHENHVDEHTLEITDANPNECSVAASGHETDHEHGPGCGHEAVPHGAHTDYLVEGRLHHPHEEHCDDHGGVKLVA